MVECEAVWKYEPNTGWLCYCPEAVLSQMKTLQEIGSGIGYWIIADEPCSLVVQGTAPVTEIALDVGWNQVGYSSRSPGPIDECMASIDSNYRSVWGYEPDEGWSWYNPLDPVNSTLQSMEPGKGYLIDVKIACTWDINATASSASGILKNSYDHHMH